jgi:hypothetical protein
MKHESTVMFVDRPAGAVCQRHRDNPGQAEGGADVAHVACK